MHGKDRCRQADGKAPSPLEVVALHGLVCAAHKAFFVAVHKAHSQCLQRHIS